MVDLTGLSNPAMVPGQRLLRTKGWEAADKYPTPRDSEVPIFDEELDYVYIKVTDVNGGSTLRRFHLEEDPIPVFDPKKYVTVDDFNSLKEEIQNGFNSIQQSIAAGSNKQTNNRQPNKPNNEQR